MRKLKIQIASLVVVAAAIIISSCGKVDECTGEKCSDEIAHIDVALYSPSGKPYILDSYTVVPKDGGDAVLSKTINSSTDTTGQYVVLSDTEKSKVTKDGVYFKFIGTKGGNEVVNLEYRIAHNCCHVVIKNGLSIDTIQ